MEFSVARGQFYQEVHQSEEQIDLARAALYMAMEEYPDLNPDEYLNALDTMATEVEERLPQERYPLRMIQTINAYLFKELGFRGNADTYYDPRNSYFNQVIDRRTGIPISLSLVYLELAKRLNFPMVGVGMPAHFLIRPLGDELDVFVDPFHQGEVLFPEDCRDRLNQIYGAAVDWRPEFLETISPRRFLARMLTNLKMVYIRQEDWERAIAAIEYILILFPDAIVERRDHGLLCYQLGDWTNARRDFEEYLDVLPTADDAIVIKQLLRRMGYGEA